MATCAFALLEVGNIEGSLGLPRGDHILAARVARPKGRLSFLCATGGSGRGAEPARY